MRFSREVTLCVLFSVLAAAQSPDVSQTAQEKVKPRNCHLHHFGDFSDWSAPQNLGSDVNSAAGDQWPAIAPNDLSLYFASNRGGGPLDLWVTQRPDANSPWGTPQRLGTNINSSSRDNTPYVSANGHWLFFGSNRPGGCSTNPTNDLYLSFRAKTDDDTAWRPAQNLGCTVNSAADEIGPNLVVDDETGTTTLYFSSNRSGVFKIYASTLNSDGTFGAAVLQPELDSNMSPGQGGDGTGWIRNDGLEMILNWNTPLNPFTDGELWVTTRASRADSWSTPQQLGPPLNSSSGEATPSLSCDGTALYFTSNRPTSGGADLWVAKRTPLDPKKQH